MHDDTLKKLALTGVIMGIVGLFLIDLFTSGGGLAKSNIADGGQDIGVAHGRIIAVSRSGTDQVVTFSGDSDLDGFLDKDVTIARTGAGKSDAMS